MNATPVADSPVVDTGATYHLEKTQKALELMRCDAVLEELAACGSQNRRLIAWYEGRRNVLRDELEIRPPVRS